MNPNELQPGDLILFYSPSGCEHVAMYTGDIDCNPYITHSVTDDNPGLKTTILKKPGLLEHYSVFRLNNPELARKACAQLLLWAKYQVPYDQRRAKLMYRINNVIRQSALKAGKEPAIALLEYLEGEATRKFYETVKFAARRNTSPVKFNIGVEGRGFTCVQAVILAYKVPELEIYVKTLYEAQGDLLKSSATKGNETKEIWISDKHCHEQTLESYDAPTSYVEYQAALNDNEEFSEFYVEDKRSTASQFGYCPSLAAWRYDLEPSIETFAKKFKSCLNLPAKICYTEGLEAYLLAHKESWLSLGQLNTATLRKEFATEEKEAYKAKTVTFLHEVQLRRASSISERSVSPRTETSSTEEESESIATAMKPKMSGGI